MPPANDRRLLQEPDLLDSIRTELKSIRDIERAVGRLSQASGNARDLVALKRRSNKSEVEIGSAEATRRLSFGANRAKEEGDIELLAQRLQNEIQEMPALAEKLTKALVDDPPLALKEAEFSVTATTPIWTSSGTVRATAKTGSANCRSARSQRPGSSRSRSVTIPCSVISSK